MCGTVQCKQEKTDTVKLPFNEYSCSRTARRTLCSSTSVSHRLYSVLCSCTASPSICISGLFFLQLFGEWKCDTEVFMERVYIVWNFVVTTVGACSEKCLVQRENTLVYQILWCLLKQKLDLYTAKICCVHAHKDQKQFQTEVTPCAKIVRWSSQ